MTNLACNSAGTETASALGTDGRMAVQYYSACKMNMEIQKWTWLKLRPFFVKNQNYDVRFSDCFICLLCQRLMMLETVFIIKNNRIHMAFAAR